MLVTVSFFRKYAGGTLADMSSMSILFNHFELPLKYQQWMDIYEYHLENPKKSQWQVSLAFRVSKGTVWNAYRSMGKVI